MKKLYSVNINLSATLSSEDLERRNFRGGPREIVEYILVTRLGEVLGYENVNTTTNLVVKEIENETHS